MKMLSSKIKVTHPSGGISSTLRSLKTSPLLIVSADPKENKMMGGKGQESSSEELEDYADSDSGNDRGEDGGEDQEDEPIVSRYAIINFSWIATFQRL